MWHWVMLATDRNWTSLATEIYNPFKSSLGLVPMALADDIEFGNLVPDIGQITAQSLNASPYSR